VSGCENEGAGTGEAPSIEDRYRNVEGHVRTISTGGWRDGSANIIDLHGLGSLPNIDAVQADRDVVNLNRITVDATWFLNIENKDEVLLVADDRVGSGRKVDGSAGSGAVTFDQELRAEGAWNRGVG